MLAIIPIAAVSYLLGSIPFGYLLVRMFHGEDVRRSGSGNIGATNVARKSPVLGVVTLLLDAAKGSAAVALAYVIADHFVGIPEYQQLAGACMFAILGHMFPVWLKFRGGKGVATALGAFAVITPKAVLVAVAVFVLVVLIFRYVSLGSILAVAAFPFLVWILHEYVNERGALLLIALSSLLIIARHHANIQRLLAGTEARFGGKSKDSPELTRSEKLTSSEKR